MKNKIELKKYLISSVIMIIILSIIFGFFSLYQYKEYTRNFNNSINAMIEKVNRKYPDIDNNELMEILNSENLEESEILESYGIDINEDTAIQKNKNQFKKYLIVNVGFIATSSIILMSIFLRYNQKKNNSLKEITKYIQEINKKNYKLDIEDNTEDELSILKNELYKITIMLKEEAENSLKDKILLKDSLSDISHQLKTPLTSIIIMLDNILDNPNMDLATREDFIKDIYREISNINFLVQSILKLSKFDSNTINFINKEEKIADLINEAMKNVSNLCDLKDIEIIVKGKDSDKICCDFKWQVEAITNILKNCVEHSSNLSKIYVSFEKNEIYSKILIRDNGVGISKKDLPHIFERFYKGENSSSDSIGIGLALSKTIIEKNKGYVNANSELGKGTEFTIKYFAV